MTASVLRPSVCAAPCASLINPLEVDVDVAMVGGKASALGRLIRSGLRVPPGFVLRTEALQSHLREARIGNTITALCDEADFAKAETRASVSTAIRDLICGAALPEVIRDELLQEYDVGEEQCSLELRELLDSMTAAKLVERTEA